MRAVYIIGSLRNPLVQEVARAVRKDGYAVFDDWHCAGPEADDHWQRYEQARGRTFFQALNGHAAANTFAFDKRHIDMADIGVLVMPAGKSAHLELGYMAGQGKQTYVLFDKEPDRWDLMYKFATACCYTVEDLLLKTMQER